MAAGNAGSHRLRLLRARPISTRRRRRRSRARAFDRRHHMKALTLPDYLGPGLDLVSIGINPSVYSVEQGFYFARPGNRFWPTLFAAGLAPETLTPSRIAVERLFRVHRIGFTDLVKRPTTRAEELSADDYRRGAQTLSRKLLRFQPRIAWFHGTSGYRLFLAH